MRRREFITLLGGAAACPLAARAQQPAMPVIGFLQSGSPGATAHMVAAFQTGLREGGYIEGQNVGIIYRFADGQYDRLPALAAELLHSQVAVLAATGGDPSVVAARTATATIPIVFTTGSDPVALGYVASLNQPGGNVTGVVLLTDNLGAKRVGLLRQLIPKADTFGVLVNPAYPVSADPDRGELLTAARAPGLQLKLLLRRSCRSTGKSQGFVAAREPLQPARAAWRLRGRSRRAAGLFARVFVRFSLF